jgi:hypothetical protein
MAYSFNPFTGQLDYYILGNLSNSWLLDTNQTGITGDKSGSFDLTTTGTGSSFGGLTDTSIADTRVVYSNSNRLEGNAALTFNSGTGTLSATEFSGGGSGLTGIEGTQILSTGEGGGTKFLREDGDGTCSWQTVAGGGGCSFGTDNQIPFTNAAGDDFDYSSKFLFDGTHAYLHADNSKQFYGAGDDASIYYDGSNLRINPQEVGSGIVIVNNGGLKLNDNDELFFGNGKDAKIYHTGSALMIKPQNTGSGQMHVDVGSFDASTLGASQNLVATYRTTSSGDFAIGGWMAGQYDGSSAQTWTTYGIQGFVYDTSTGGNSRTTLPGMNGGLYAVRKSGSGTVAWAANLASRGVHSAGTTTKWDGIAILDPAKTGGTVTNYYGLHIYDLDPATTNWGIYDEGNNWALAADNSKLYFGAGQDASIYFDAADLIINSENVTANDEVHFTNFDRITTDSTFKGAYESSDGSAGLSTTFLDADGNTITVKDGLITAKTAP